MSWWPWVSRARLEATEKLNDALREEVRWLRQQNEDLREDVTRIRRFEAGMSETKRPERKEMKPMPQRLKDHIAQWDSPDLKRSQQNEAYRRHGRGESWDSIMRDIMDDDE